jgi:carboxyl-terminal processing protease
MMSVLESDEMQYPASTPNEVPVRALAGGVSRLLAVACAVAAACTPVHADRALNAPWPEAGSLTPLIGTDGTMAAQFRGAWRSRGYGWVLDIDADGLTRYQEGEVCYPTPEATRRMSAMAAVEYRYARALPDDAAIFQLLDGDTNVVFDRLDALPQACEKPVDTSPTAVAAAFLDHFDRHYAFFDRRLPDHDAKAALLRRNVHDEMSEAELWDALAAFMDGLSDSHTKLIGAVNGEQRRQQDGQGETLPQVRATSGEPAWLIGLINQTMEQLGETGVHTLNDRLIRGMIEPASGQRVGYLQLFVMGGFTDRSDFASDAWAEAEMTALNAAHDEAFAAFQRADAVIVDLSNNRGGWDRVAKALPGRFTDAPFIGFTTRSRGSGLAPFPHVIEPAEGPRFTGPVRLLTIDVTVSGGELATLAFRQLPNVTHYGGTTRGAFSTPLAKPLPNGWLLELSNETFAAPGGEVFEETGIAPDVALEVYPAGDPIGGHWRAIMTLASRPDASNAPESP